VEYYTKINRAINERPGGKNSTEKSWQKENQGEPLSSSPNDLGPAGKRVASYLEFTKVRPQTAI
jgi:hypothetical protein